MLHNKHRARKEEEKEGDDELAKRKRKRANGRVREVHNSIKGAASKSVTAESLPLAYLKSIKFALAPLSLALNSARLMPFRSWDSERRERS